MSSQSHSMPMHELNKMSVAADNGLLYSQPFTNNHYHFLVKVKSAAYFSGPKGITAFFITVKWRTNVWMVRQVADFGAMDFFSLYRDGESTKTCLGNGDSAAVMTEGCHHYSPAVMTEGCHHYSPAVMTEGCITTVLL